MSGALGWAVILGLSGGEAWAAGVSGSGVPGSGGGFAGATEAGALGAIYSPGAVATGGRPELLVDLGAFWQDLTFDIDDIGEIQHSAEWIPQPSGAIAIPLGRFGVGAALQGPYVRGGDDDPEGPYRFVSFDSTLQLIEADVLVGYRPHERITLGLGLRTGQVTYLSYKAVDTGDFLNDSLTVEPPLPVGDPLLEGQQRVGALSGFGVSWAASVGVRLPADVEAHLSFRPGWRVGVSGPVVQEPSNTLNTVISGNAEVELGFPSHLILAGRIPVGRFTFIPEVEHIGWKRTSTAQLTLSDLTLESSDPLFDGILSSSGLAEADFLTSSEGTSEVPLSWRDVVNPGLQLQWEPSPKAALRTGLWYTPTAVPDAVATASNIDFGATIVRLAGAWQPASPLRVALSAEKFFSPLRTITDSVSVDPPVVPSGNGTYDLDLWRLSLSLQVFVPKQTGAAL